MFTRFKCFAAGLLILFTVIPGAAEEKKKEEKDKTPQEKAAAIYRVEQAEKVVVTATMTPRALEDCAAAVDLVEKGDIEAISANGALNILNFYPGIFVNRSGDFGRADVDIRGLGQNCRRVAVLVDGRPEKMGLFGCAVSHAFPLDNVDHIEVVKGPASVLYGGEALGGAVHIITREPREKFEADLSVSAGSFATRQFNLKQGANLGKFKYFLTYDNRKSDGHVANSGYSGQSITGKVQADLSQGSRLTLQAKYFDGRKDEPGTISQPLDNLWNDYKRGSVDLGFSNTWNDKELHFKLYRVFGDHEFSDGWDSRDYTNGITARFVTRVPGKNELLLGGDLRFFGGQSFSWPQGEWDKTEGSLFIRDEFIPSPRWILSGGFRVQFDSLYGSEWCPNLGLVFQAGHRTLFRATMSKGFRSPQLNELYMYPPANAELEPERAWNYEAGFQQRFGRHLTLKGSLFVMEGSNMIQTVPNPEPGPPYIFANTGEFSFKGVEMEMEFFLGAKISGKAGYSLTDFGDLTRGRPGQKADLSLRFRGEKILAALQAQYVSDYFAADFSQDAIPSYFLLNSRLIFSLAGGLDLVLDVNNILDEEYVIYGEFPGITSGLYRMPGRNIQLGFRYRVPN